MTGRIVFLDRASLKAKVRKPSFASEYIEHEKTAEAEIVPRLRDAYPQSSIARPLQCTRDERGRTRAHRG